MFSENGMPGSPLCAQGVQIPTTVTKWLRGLGVDEVQLRGLSWQKLALPGGHGKGMWWLPQAHEGLPGDTGKGSEGSAGLALAAADDLLGDSADLLRAAAEQVSVHTCAD